MKNNLGEKIMVMRKMSLMSDPVNEYDLRFKSFFDLGITSQKSAILLNFLLDKKLHSCDVKRGYYYRAYSDSHNVKGGGLFIKGSAQITINDINEVGIYFNDKYAINKYIRVAAGQASLIKTIKDKIANELKKLWKNFQQNEKIFIDVNEYTEIYDAEKIQYNVLNINQNFVTVLDNDKKVVSINFNEYRALYEFLKSRDIEKIKERNGIEVFNTMIGNRITNQFIISAIDVIKNEIKNVKEEYNEICAKAEQDFNDAYMKIKEVRDNAKDAAEKILINKINEFNTQLNELVTASFAMMTE